MNKNGRTCVLNIGVLVAKHKIGTRELICLHKNYKFCFDSVIAISLQSSKGFLSHNVLR